MSDLSVSDLPRSIPALAERAAARYGSAEGVVDGDIRMTFAELAAAGRAAARAFIASGIEPGDRVAIWAPNVAQWVIDHAIQAFGAAGVTEDFGLAEMFAGARSLRIADGPDEVHKMVIARRELARYIKASS